MKGVAAPDTIVNKKNVGVKFTGPLAQLRRMKEMQGVESVLALAGQIGQFNAEAMDNIDFDETLELTREIRGAPRKMFRLDEEKIAIRQQRAQQAEQQAQMAMMQGMAQTARDATPAMQTMMRAGGMPA